VIDESKVMCRQGEVKVIGTDGALMTRSTNNFAQVGVSLYKKFTSNAGH